MPYYNDQGPVLSTLPNDHDWVNDGRYNEGNGLIAAIQRNHDRLEAAGTRIGGDGCTVKLSPRGGIIDPDLLGDAKCSCAIRIEYIRVAAVMRKLGVWPGV